MLYRFMITCTLITTLGIANNCRVHLESLWHPIEPTINSDAWVVIGSITFVNKSTQRLTIQELYLSWHGPYIETLHALLFSKKHRHRFLATEEFCIGSGTWNKNTQQLHLSFNKPLRLTARTTVYVTLIMPPTIQTSLCNGYFTIATDTLTPEGIVWDQHSSLVIQPLCNATTLC